MFRNKTIYIGLALMLYSSITFPQKQSLEHDKYFEREFHRYEDLIRKAEAHAKLIMKNIYKPNAQEYFTNCVMDTTHFGDFLKSLNYLCNFEKGIGAYVGFFLEDNVKYQKKMLHCIFEYELECGSKYIQLSYFLDRNENSFNLKNFYRKSTDKDDDIISNVIHRN